MTTGGRRCSPSLFKPSRSFARRIITSNTTRSRGLTYNTLDVVDQALLRGSASSSGVCGLVDDEDVAVGFALQAGRDIGPEKTSEEAVVMRADDDQAGVMSFAAPMIASAGSPTAQT